MDGETCGESDALADLSTRNGCVGNHLKIESDDGESERVGVLDYKLYSKSYPTNPRHYNQTAEKCSNLPLGYINWNSCGTTATESFNHVVPAPDSPCQQNIELKTFSISESHSDGCSESCASIRDQRSTTQVSSCMSDDDDLLNLTDADDSLRQVIVQSEHPPGSAMPCNDGASISLVDSHRLPGQGLGHLSVSDHEVAKFLRCIPSPFGSSRDAAWSHPDTAQTSPIASPVMVNSPTTVAMATNLRASSHTNSNVSLVTDRFDNQALRGRSSSRERSPVAEIDRNPDVRLGLSSLPPVEVVSMDRNQMDPNSITRSNVLYLNDYSLWTNAARAFCREESSAAADRTEVEKRQERRNKKKKKCHVLPVELAEDVAGYVGNKELEELVEYINRGEAKSAAKGKSVQLHAASKKISMMKPTKKTTALKRTSDGTELVASTSEQVGLFVPSVKFVTLQRVIVPTSSSASLDDPSVDEQTPVPTAAASAAADADDGDAAESEQVSKETRKPQVKKTQGAYLQGENSHSDEVYNERSSCSSPLSHMSAIVTATIGHREPCNSTTTSLPPSDLEHSAETTLLCPSKDMVVTLPLPPETTLPLLSKDMVVVLAPSKNVKGSLRTVEPEVLSGAFAGVQGLVTKGVVDPEENGKGHISTERIESTDVVEPGIDQGLSFAKTVVSMAPMATQSHTSMTSVKLGAMSVVSTTMTLPMVNSLIPQMQTETLASSSFPPLVADLVSLRHNCQDQSSPEEDGSWEEFQSKKKRGRNHVSQDDSKSPMMVLRKSSPGGGMIKESFRSVPSYKKPASDTSAITVKAVNGGGWNPGWIDHGRRVQGVSRGSSKFPRRGSTDGGSCSIEEATTALKLSEAPDNVTFCRRDSFDSFHSAKSLPVSEKRSRTESSIPKVECLSYAKIAAGEVGSFSLEQLSDAMTSKSQAENNVVSLKDFASNIRKSTKKVSDEAKPKTVDDSAKMDNAAACRRTTDSLAMKVGHMSEGAARPPVVFCDRLKHQQKQPNSGISFEFCGESPAQLFPSTDSSTSPIADVRLDSGCFLPVPKSNETTATAPGLNCSRPIAPLSGPGHASSTKPPVLVVSPLPKVSQDDETVTVPPDTDPEMLKVMTIAAAGLRRNTSADTKMLSVASMLTSSTSRKTIHVDNEVRQVGHDYVEGSTVSAESAASERGRKDGQNMHSQVQGTSSATQEMPQAQHRESPASPLRVLIALPALMLSALLAPARFAGNEWAKVVQEYKANPNSVHYFNSGAN